ncbi:aldehyde ferredoxin oxidoreductase family protein [Chloroflexota bacterium]
MKLLKEERLDMINGYNGEILRVNLTQGEITVDKPSPEFYRQYMGGRAMTCYYLLKEVPAGTDALAPENKMIFATGPVTGAPVGGCGRNSVGAKSPLTGGLGSSEVGGYWGSELKLAGYDAVIIEGKSANPVYLWIQDGKAEIKDAKHLRGKPTLECQRLIQEELGDEHIRVAQSGLAGENLVRYACVINDMSHAAGRTGMGAVMGSKNLRAIAVRGHGKFQAADPEAVADLGKWFRDNFKNIKRTAVLSVDGTQGLVMAINSGGGLPTRNFREGIFEGATKISFEVMRESIFVKRGGCYACPVKCKAVVASGEPYNIDPNYGGPEYETLSALGSNCGVDNLEAIAKANQLCGAYGLDSISTGVSIAFAIECFEKGILTEQDTGGLKLKFGDAEIMLQLVEMIARREGIGKLLGEGVARAAAAIGKGAEEYAMHIKGQEIPMHEPRFKQGMGVGYTVSPTGAEHMHNMHDAPYAQPGCMLDELIALGIPGPLPLLELGPAKIRMLVYASLWRHLLDCLVFCNFCLLMPDQISGLIRAVTGWNSTVWELMKVAERCINMGRVFNYREGMTKADDCLPCRFAEPLPSGPMEGETLGGEKLQQAIDSYYAMVGWDKETGSPTLAKVQELGIEWIVEA